MIWPTMPVAQFCKTGTGTTPLRAEGARFYGGPIPWVKSGELAQGVVCSTEETLTNEAVETVNIRLIEPGALLVALYGATVGQVAELGIRATTNQAVCHVIPDPDVADRRYMYYALRRQAPIWIRQRVGGAQPNISQGIVKQTQIPLPPLSEQRRIASILDQADGIRRRREEGLRLTDELLRSTFLDMFGDPAANPKGWEVVPVCRIAHEMEGGRSILADSDEAARTPYRVLKVSAVTWADYRPHESKPVPVDYNPPASHIVKKDDLLFSRANTTELVGATAYVFDSPPNLLLPDKIWRFVWRDAGAISPQYIRALFLTASIKRELGRRATGTSGSMKNISKAKLMSLPIPNPPVALQRRFGEFAISQHRLLTERREAASSASELFGALVQSAFRGEL